MLRSRINMLKRVSIRKTDVTQWGIAVHHSDTKTQQCEEKRSGGVRSNHQNATIQALDKTR